jgi:hypothetical protein
MTIEIGIPTSVSDIVQAIKDESIEPSEVHTDKQRTEQREEHGLTTVSSDGTIDDAAPYWRVDTDNAGATITRTLSSSIAEDGREVNIKRDGSYDVTIDTEGSETIDGSSSIVLNKDQKSVTLVFNNADSDWEIW